MTNRNRKPAPAANVAAFVMVDGIKVDLSDIHTATLESVLADMVEGERKAYGAHIRISAKFNDLMAFAWFDIDNGEVSDNATALKPHKEALYKAFKAAGHSNPSVPFKRIRDYGRNLRAGLAPSGKSLADGSPIPAGEGEGAAGEGANPAKRSDMLFAVEEGTKLYKRLSKSEQAKIVAAMPHLVAFMNAIGVDVRTIKKG